MQTSFFSTFLLGWKFYSGLWEWWEILDKWWSHQSLAANFLSRYDSEGVLQKAWTGMWKKKMLFWFHHNFSLHPLYSGLHFLFQYNVTGWSNFRGFWKFSGEDLWNQGTSTRYTREENKAKVVLSLGAICLQLQHSQIQCSSNIIHLV